MCGGFTGLFEAVACTGTASLTRLEISKAANGALPRVCLWNVNRASTSRDVISKDLEMEGKRRQAPAGARSPAPPPPP